MKRFRVAAIPFIFPLAPHVISTLMADTTQTVASPTRFVVTITGKGPDVILIPGLASSGAVWDATVTELKQHHRVHVVQLAGFAGTPPASIDNGVIAPFVEDLADYITAQHLKAPAVIGHSIGGESALMLAARHPEAVRKVMAVDALPFYSLLIDPKATATSMKPMAEEARADMLKQSAADFERSQKQTAAFLCKTVAKQPTITNWSITSDRATVAAAVYEAMTTDLRPELKNIKAPTTVLYAYDPAYGFTAGAADAMWKSAYASATKFRLGRIDGSYHFVMFDQAKKFAIEVTNFLNSPPPPVRPN
jgi:pimeloyl-ACP methyl ester carboxylesterase